MKEQKNDNQNEIRESQNDEGAIPAIPLPNPGEGGAVYPGQMRPDMNQNNNNGNMPGFIPPNIIGTIISTHPRPNEPCRFCNPNIAMSGNVRFLNAANGYNSFVVFINENLFSTNFTFGELTGYERVASGNQMVTVMGENGYIYIQKPVRIQNNERITIAIINSESGLDIEVIDDIKCNRNNNMSCIRAVNLAYYSNPLSVVIGNQYINFNNLRFKDVSNYETIWQGQYIYSVMRNMVARVPGMGGVTLLTSQLNIQNNKNYTMYILNWQNSSDAIKVVIVEEVN